MSRRRPPIAGVRLRSLGGLARRNLTARPLRALLTAAGIVLGVGLIFGVLLLVRTIDSTFSSLFESVYGRADLIVEPPQEDGSVRAATLRQVRGVAGIESAQGALTDIFVRVRLSDELERRRAERRAKREAERLARLEARRRALAPPGASVPPSAERPRPARKRDPEPPPGSATPDSDAAEINVSGIDPRAPDTAGVTYTAGRRVQRRREIELEEQWAEDQALEPGDRLRVATATGTTTYEVVGVFRFARRFGFGGEGFGRVPIRDARAVMDKLRGYDEVTAVVSDSADLAAVQRSVQAAVGDGVDVETPQGKSDDVSDQLRGLTALLVFFAGMGLVVGGFLIFNSFQITVLQRQRELGMLRTLGMSRGAILRSILREAAILAAVGSVLGLVAGAGLAVGLVQVMSALGFPVSGLTLSWPALVVALVAGVIVTVVGALWPAYRAGRVPPLRAVLGIGEVRRPPRAWRLALGLALSAAGLAGAFTLASATETPTPVVAAGLVGVILIFFGVALAAPFLIGPLVRVLAWPLRALSPIEGRLASDSARSNPGRTAATASGLMIGLALVTAFGSLGSSFLGSVERELDTTFARDLTVQPSNFSPGAGPQQAFSPRLRRRLERLPDAAVVTPQRLFFSDDLPGGDGLAFGFDPASYGEVDESEIVGGNERQVMARVAAGQVTIGEALAKQEKIEPGDSVRLRGSEGRRRARVAGIVKTAIFGGQTVGMSLETMRAVYGVRKDSSLAIKAASDAGRAALERRVAEILEDDYPQLQVLSNDELKSDIESQVNRQFGFFNALLGVAVLVSLFGVINTLSMSVLERTREIGVLRALGSRRWQVRRSIGGEGLLLSLVGALLGVVVGLALGYVFVRGIATSVPSVEYTAPLGTIAAVAASGVVLGLVASILPARRAARMDVIEALSYE